MAFNPFSFLKSTYESTIGKAADYLTSSKLGQTVLGSKTEPKRFVATIGAGLTPQQKTSAENLLVGKYGQSPGIATGVVNPINRSLVPNISTEFGPGYADPITGKITLSQPRQDLPNYPQQKLYTPAIQPGVTTSAPTQNVGRDIDPRLIAAGRAGGFVKSSAGDFPILPFTPSSSEQFSRAVGGNLVGSDGMFNITGGASLLPGSIGGGFRMASFPFPTKEDEKKKKRQVIDNIENALQTGRISDLLNPQQPGFAGYTAGGQSIPGATAGQVINPADVSRLQTSGVLSKGGFEMGLGASQSGKLAFQGGRLGATQRPDIGGGAVAISGTRQEPIFQPFMGGPLSEADKQLISTVSETPKAGVSAIDPSIPSTTELAGTKAVGDTGIISQKNIKTQSDLNNYVGNRITQIIDASNQRDIQYSNQILDQQSENAIQTLSSRSQEFFGQQLSPDQVRAFVQTDPRGQVLYDQTFLSLKDAVINPVTNQPWRAEDFQLKDPLLKDKPDLYNQLDALQKQIDDFTTKDPLAGRTFENLSQQLMKDLGVSSAKQLRDKKQEEIDKIIGAYEGITTEIKNDPDFSKNLKARRLEYVSNKQADAVRLLQRDIDRLNTQITDGTQQVADRINTIAKDYAVFQDRRNTLQNKYDKLLTNIDKASDNARAAITTLINNPGLAATITDAEIDYIYRTGNFPASLIKKVNSSLGTKYDTFINKEDANGNVTIIGVNKDGTNKIIGQYGGIGTPSTSTSGSGLESYVVTRPDGTKEVVYFKKPTGPGTISLGPSGEISASEKKSLFFQYLSQVRNSKGKSELEKEALAAGVDTSEKDVKAQIDKAKKGVFGRDEPLFQGTFTDYLSSRSTSQQQQLKFVTVTSSDGRVLQMNLTQQQIQQLQAEGNIIQ